MKIVVRRESFLKNISKIQGIVKESLEMPILSTVLVETFDKDIRITASNLEIQVQQRIEAEIIGKGVVAILGKKLYEIIKASNNSEISIEFVKDQNKVLITDGRAKFKLTTIPSDEFPIIKEPPQFKSITIPAELLLEMIKKTIYVVPTHAVNINLTGIYIHRVKKEEEFLLKMVGTDGHRLSTISKPISGIKALDLEKGKLVPKEAILKIQKIIQEVDEVEIGFFEENMIIKTDNSMIIIRLLQSKYPDYQKVIPKNPLYSFSIDRNLLLNAMKRMLIVGESSYSAVNFALGEDKLYLASNDPNIGEVEEVLPIVYNGDEFNITFNAKYFIETLQVIKSEKVNIGLVEESRPCIIKGNTDPGFLALIMPMNRG